MNALSLISTLIICTLLPCAMGAEPHPQEEPSSSTARKLELDDSFKIKGVGSPTLSYDGKWVAYTISTQNFEKNSSSTRIWMQSTQDGKPFPMSADKLSSWTPKFSRDSKKLYFLSARNGERTQLWFLDLGHGGEAQQVTSLERGVNAINFTRDETKLLLVW
jgi:dipeptidyl aminopeptidase/acylaminoacyl peptidase